MAPDLVLIRHAETRQDPSRESARWELSASAPAACARLAEALRPLDLGRLVTSEEPKAQATGRLLAERLAVPWESAPGLEEHHRQGVPFMVAEAWQRTLERFFAAPEARVLGQESAAEARDRFGAALRAVLARHSAARLGVVGHASVMALFVAAHNRLDAYTFWRTLRMPDALRLSLPGFALLERLEVNPAGGA